MIGLSALLSQPIQASDLEINCLACHAKNQIPNNLIYKRYLMKYSTETRMQKAIFDYLKNPDKKDSIMPQIFFTKFPMKENLTIDDKILNQSIISYLKEFNLKNKLINSH